MTVNSGVSGKGWHNENLRHSQAKRFGKASGGKVSAPKSVGSISKRRKTAYKNLHNAPNKDAYGNEELTITQARRKREEMQKEGKIKVDKKITPSDYAGFTGSFHLYKDYLGIKLTDGVKDLQTRANANWLTSDIAVIVKANPKVRKQDFVSINLNVKDDNTATATYGDGNGNNLYTQKYKYTDFPKGKWKFFYRDNTLMMPSEY